MQETTPAEQDRQRGADAEGDIGSPGDINSAADESRPNSTDTPQSPVEERPARSTGRWWDRSQRWWVAVVVGLLTSLPLAWLLSFAASLPFFLGLFFFVLFGLMIGAATFRIAAPGRPYPSGAILVGTSAIVLTGWGGSIFKEGYDFPTDMAKLVARRTRDIGDRSATEFKAEVAGQVRQFLRERYPPGGSIGFIKWILSSGKLNKGDLATVDRTLSRSQWGWVWALRVLLSIAALAFGVASQTWALRQS